MRSACGPRLERQGRPDLDCDLVLVFCVVRRRSRSRSLRVRARPSGRRASSAGLPSSEEATPQLCPLDDLEGALATRALASAASTSTRPRHCRSGHAGAQRPRLWTRPYGRAGTTRGYEWSEGTTTISTCSQATSRFPCRHPRPPRSPRQSWSRDRPPFGLRRVRSSSL